jgi:serine/threonine protein kinase
VSDAAEAPTSAPPDSVAGRVLASKYRILRQIGEGGMGVVHLGEHLELKTRVAIKRLQPKLATDATARARFLREARLAASIEGEHSARIHDVGTDDDGRPYMVMEHLVGETADARLAREGKIPLQDAATIVLQLLDALSEAHAKGLVHRDLKPGNIFLTERTGEAIWVKVVDFGISKATSPEHGVSSPSLTLTEPRTLLGSPEYMSPEQLRDSASVDARSDIWACGVVLFELLSGKVPFEASSLADLYARIVSGEPKTLAEVGVAGVPAAVTRLIERCLRKAKEERPQSAYEIAVALAPHASDSSKNLLPRIRAWCKSEDSPAQTARPRRAAVGLTLIALAGVLAFGAASLRAPAPPPRPTQAAMAPLATLDPVAPQAPTPTTDAASSAEPPPVAVGASKDDGKRPKTTAKPRAKTPTTGHVRDLEHIDLIQ